MNLPAIAWKNLQRRKSRALFLVVGLLIGVATVVTLLSLAEGMTVRAQHEMENYGANILITPRSDTLSLSYGGITLGGVNVDQNEIAQTDLDLIPTIPNSRNIALVAPKVLGAATVGRYRVLLMGVDPEVEFWLKRWWAIDGRALQEPEELVLGSAVAVLLGLKMGDSTEINGRLFTVVGVLQQTGSQDDHLVIGELAIVQDLLGKQGQVSLVEVAALCADCPIEDILQQLTEVLPHVEVNAIQQVVASRMHALQQFRLFAWAVALVVMVIGALMVFVTMMASVNERTREIGIFRALGFRRGHIMQLILTESSVVSLVAGVLGYLAGFGAAWLLLPQMDGMEEMSHGGHGALAFDPLMAFGAVLLALVVGLLASLYPALHASRLDPLEALRAL